MKNRASVQAVYWCETQQIVFEEDLAQHAMVNIQL
jgi:hypothetical protein